MKNKVLSLVLCLSGITAVLCVSRAQNPPTNIPAPAPDAAQQDRLQQALRRATAARTNVLATPGQIVPFTEGPTRVTTNVAAVGDSPNVYRNTTTTVPALRSNSIVVPSGGPRITGPVTNAPGVQPQVAGQVDMFNSATLATNAPEDVIPAGVIDFRAADLKDVLTLYAELVNRTILRASTLPDIKIVLKTQTALTKREAVQALSAVLGMNGIYIVPIGDKFMKAVIQADALNTGQDFDKRTTEEFPDIGPFITHVVQLKYAKPSEMVQVLQPFAKSPNAVFPIDSSQIIVLRDFTENVKRMRQMISEVDVVVPSEFVSEVIPIKYALSSDIANALNSLSSGGGSTSVGTRQGTGGGGGSRMGGSGSFGFGNRSGVGGMGGGMGGSYGGQYGQQGVYPQATGTQQAAPGAAGGAGTFSDRLRNIINRASTSGDIQVIGQTKIIADERTNSLLVFATREDMKTIKDIVSKLDIVLAQVLIEAVIIQVTLNDSHNLGVSYVQHPITSGNFTGVGSGGGSRFLSASDFLSGSGGTNGSGGVGGGFNYLARFGNDLDVTVTAAANDNHAKILQRPRIQTSNAKQATLFVGESRPYPTASYYGGGAYGGYSSIQQMQIGVTIDVTPLINPDGLVVMDIHQRIESVAGTVSIVNVGDVPITSSKEAQASVAVRDRDTIILGGLIETTKSQGATGVPYLKDIPLLGYLFRSSTHSEDRNELIVLIRPTVLPTPEIAALTAKAEKERMPGVSRTEQEIQAEETQRLKAWEKEKRTTRTKPSVEQHFAPANPE